MYWSQIGTAPWGTNQASINIPSTGLFTWQASYGLQSCTDESSDTIAFAESAVGSQSLIIRQKLSGIVHPGGVNVTMADGSVKFIKDSINLQTWMALGTKGNGEVISSNSY